MNGEKKFGHPERGVTTFSYSEVLNVCMTLEDCFKDMKDMGVTCIEILAGHIENYPNPTEQWVDQWYALCAKYDIHPAELGHWYDTRVYRDRYLDVEESLEYLEYDFRLAHRLGFHLLRTKLTCINSNCDPVPGWEEYLKRACDLAEKYDVVMGSEIHRPTPIKTKHISDYIDFIERTGTKNFGFTLDFGTFQNCFPDELRKLLPLRKFEAFSPYSEPEDLIDILPYVICCHGKFYYIDENFHDAMIPNEKVLKLLVENGYSGPIVSEFEGMNKQDYLHVADQLRRHQILMKNVLGY